MMKLTVLSLLYLCFCLSSVTPLNTLNRPSDDGLMKNGSATRDQGSDSVNVYENHFRSELVLDDNDASDAAVSIVLSDSDYEDIILDRIELAMQRVLGKQCAKDLNSTLLGIRRRKSWAIAMYDASVKTPAGIEYGSVYQFGNFDQCMGVRTDFQVDRVNIEPKYCLIDVNTTDYHVRRLASRKHVVTNSTLIHWGVCLPATCTSNDVILFFRAATGYSNVSIEPNKCHVNKPLDITTLDIIYGCVIIAFISMIVFSTIYHLYMMSRKTVSNKIKTQPRGLFENIMKSFSVVENMQKLGKTSSNELGLGCINGIKALAMMFIVAGHALVFMVGGPVQNSSFYEKESKLVQNAFLLNSPLLVDSFLLLSGFLFARLLLLELEKRRGKVNFFLLYIFRYIRLTPAYLAMIGLYATWLRKIGDGPIWDSRMALEQERCMNSWWKNLLYINNYIGNEQLCMFQSWYLATDTQLFIVAPLILYPLWRWRRAGASLLGVVSVISVIIPFCVTLFNKLDPTFLAFADEISDLSANHYFIHFYGKTHMRATAYVFGILVGFLVHVMQQRDMKLSRPIVYVCWTTATIVGSMSMFSLTFFYHSDIHFTILENSIYAGLHRLGWSLATGWIVLACVCGYGGPLTKLFSAKVLAPFSRLNYCSYLTNGFVELYLASSIRTPRYMSVISLLGDTLSHVALTFLAALILCLMFESPIHGIEKIILRMHGKTKEVMQEQDTSINSISTNQTSFSSNNMINHSGDKYLSTAPSTEEIA